MDSFNNYLKNSLNKNILPILFLILGSCYILFFYKLGAISLFDVDEPRYAETARNILENRDWITPWFDGKIRYDKPILFYWLIAIAYKIFGINEFAARFWSATFATSLVLLIFFIGRKFLSLRTAILSSLVFSISSQIILLARASITDMTLTFFISTSLFLFYLGYTGNDRSRKYFYLLFYACMALATLTKGPVGIVIPFLTIIFFTLINKTFFSTFSKMMLFQGFFVMAIIILPWNLAMFKIHREEFIWQFYIRHNINRFAGVVSGHDGSFFFYLPVILLGFFPWAIFLPSAILNTITSIKESPVKNKETASIKFFALIWFFVVFFFFTISKTKLATYITPLFPPMAILVGKLFDDVMQEKEKVIRYLKLPVIILIITFFLISAFSVFFPAMVNKFKSDSVSSFFNNTIDLKNIPWILSAVLIVGIVFFSISWFRNLRHLSIFFLILTVFLFHLIGIIYVGPEIGRYRQDSLRDLSEFTRNIIKKDDVLISYCFNKPSILFYARHPVKELNEHQREQLYNYLTSDTGVYVIIKKSSIYSLKDAPKYHILKNEGDYILISNRSTT